METSLCKKLKSRNSDFENHTEKQLESVFLSNKPNTEKLREYLLSQEMPPELHVNRISDEDKVILCQRVCNNCMALDCISKNERL